MSATSALDDACRGAQFSLFPLSSLDSLTLATATRAQHQAAEARHVTISAGVFMGALYLAHRMGLSIGWATDAQINAHWRAQCPDVPARPLGRPLVAAGVLGGLERGGYLVVARSILERATHVNLAPLHEATAAVQRALWILAGWSVITAAEHLPQVTIFAGVREQAGIRVCTGCSRDCPRRSDASDPLRCRLLPSPALLRA